MTETVEHGPKGGVVPEDLRAIRKVPTLMGNKNDAGEDFIEFPIWFTRSGVRTAEIDTGLGVVVVKAGSFSEKQLDSDSGYSRFLELIVDMPDWEAEYDVTIPVRGKGDNIAVPANGPIPHRETILILKDHKAARIYVEECFPPSILQQVITAQYFLRLPPIAYVSPQTED